MSKKAIHTVRFILGDQLNQQHSWFKKQDDGILYVLMEVRQETDYVRHHLQKVTAFFAAMRRFAGWLEGEGHQVWYFRLNDNENEQSIPQNIKKVISETGARRLEYQLPDEYRLDEQLKAFCASLDMETAAYDTGHFITERTELKEFFKGKKSYLMEAFYRDKRKQLNILMKEGEPVGGRWNYDAENRKKLPKDHVPVNPLLFDHDVTALVEMLEAAGVQTMGNMDARHFSWPIDRDEALQLLEFFVTECLPLFGTYQDAMHTDHWSLYHARLSFALNTKMLHPLEVVSRCIEEWEGRQEEISLSQIEGFVRQIIGWREYMRGIYWAHMPGYAEENFFNHQRKLPGWYWTGDTNMNCMKHAIGQSLDHAYAHHIQRLMVTGNFALLAGIHPDEVDLWYLSIYIDAIEWVEITNTRGMSQFADGGLVGTKPYVSSANYMHKMSNYCSGCHYDRKKKYGEGACPFNSLYWHFYDRHRDKLEGNPRIGMMYRVLNKMDNDDRNKMLQQAEHYLEHIETL